MDQYECRLYSSRTEGHYPTGGERLVRAELTLRFEAASYEEAGQVVRACLPGADWERWETTFGPVRKEPVTA